MLIMVVATTATTVASPDRWKLPTPEWKAPTQAPQSRRDGRRRRTTTGGSIVPTWDQDERSENSGLFYGALLWVTSVNNNSGGWFWWNRKTWTNEEPKKQWHRLDHWFVGLISSKQQGNYGCFWAFSHTGKLFTSPLNSTQASCQEVDWCLTVCTTKIDDQ